ncbi:MAG: TonB-dependent receptor [Candidatus Neomarinimicrobiota bacterium]
MKKIALINTSLKAILLLTLVTQSMAETTGKVSGRAVDAATGEPLIGCNIIVEDIGLGAASDLDGNYYVINIPPGIYNLKAIMIGYTPMRLTGVEVSSGFTTDADFALPTEVLLGQEVTVVAEKPLIKRDLTASTAVVNSSDFDKLPVTEISEALELQAGYVDGHLRGGRSGEVSFWIDGVPVTDVYDGGTVVDINKSAVEEMQLISGAFNAEYGQAMSGIVNIITKDGSNDFGGSITAYSGDFYSSHDDIFMNVGYFNPLTSKNIEANIEGSIIHDKLFYYLSGRMIYYQGIYEGRDLFRPNSLFNWYTDTLDQYQYFVIGAGDEIINLDPFDFGTLGYLTNIDSIVTASELLGSGFDPFNPSDPIAYQEAFDSVYQHLQEVHQGSAGTDEYVPMDWNIKKYWQAKLVYKMSPFMKLKYTIINDDVTYQEYDRAYKYNPEGILTRYRHGITQLLQFHHSLGSKTFYAIGFTRFNKTYDHRTYSKNEEENYVHSIYSEELPYSFKTGGTNNNVFERETVTNTIKFDLTSQANMKHLIKTGIEYRIHELAYSNVNLQPPVDKIAIDPFWDGGLLGEPVVMDDSTIHSSSYNFSPIEFSTYIQDKIEFDELIINAGVRFDYFDPKGKILNDPSDPGIYNPIRPENRYYDLNENGIQDEGEPVVTLAQRQEYWYKDTSAKWKISPRLGVSFPFTDRGVIHFSYGHFFQIPRFELLYQNPDYDLDQGTGNVGVVGNSDLRPEKTVSGELGLQQQISNNISLDITGYFRDIRDLTGTQAEQISMFGGSSSYSRLENSDFAYIRGIVFSLSMQTRRGWSGNFDYTFQIARGSASDPEQARDAIAGGQLPEVQMIPLNWDQTHTVNLSASYAAKYFGGSTIAQFGSGLPYTPESVEDISSLVQNSARRPVTWNVDFRCYYRPPLFDNNMTIFLRVFNLLDHLNQTTVYDDSGVADKTIEINRAMKTNPPEIINTIEEWYRNETYYSNPRKIEIGVTYAI